MDGKVRSMYFFRCHPQNILGIEPFFSDKVDELIPSIEFQRRVLLEDQLLIVDFLRLVVFHKSTISFITNNQLSFPLHK